MKEKIDKFKFVTPTIEYKKKAIKYIKEHQKYKSKINGSGYLANYLNDYEGWLKILEYEKYRKVTTTEVPSETFFLVRIRDNKIIGMLNLRTAMNEKVKNSYGTIGYGIRPE